MRHAIAKLRDASSVALATSAYWAAHGGPGKAAAWAALSAEYEDGADILARVLDEGMFGVGVPPRAITITYHERIEP